VIHKLLSRVDPGVFHRSGVSPDAILKLRYLGTAGFVVELAQRTLVIDPFVTRPGIWELLSRPLVPNAQLISELIPKADDVLLGHTHYDHALDAPEVCKQTGARLIGSASAWRIGYAAGLPDSQLVETHGGEDIACGAVTVRGLPSRHGKVYSKKVPLTGPVPGWFKWPARLSHFRHGRVFNWLITGAGTSMIHVDSADFIEEELEGFSCDVLCLCAIGRHRRPHYVERAVEILKPRVIIPCHWDWFGTPFEPEPTQLPRADVVSMVDEIRQTGAQAVVLPLNGEWGWSG
jgi:L-ascorbate metabolism protein UlaG (beta-lactamase superfamily)